MNDKVIQACELNLDMDGLKKEVLHLFDKSSYGNNKNWEKVHLYNCYHKKDMTIPKYWSEINTPGSIKFHKNLNLNEYIFKANNNLIESPYMCEVLNSITNVGFKNSLIYLCDVSILKKNGSVATHRDQNVRPYMSNESVWKRFHIPIITNNDNDFVINDKTYNLQEGILYKLRTTYPHSVENHSQIDRYHLIIDIHPRDVNGNLVWFTPTTK